jgi:cell division protein ZapA
MTRERTQYKVEIFGEQYVLVSDESADHIASAARLVDTFMKEITTKAAGADTKKVAILVALQLASQLLNLQEKREKDTIAHANLIHTVEHILSTYAR